jgi:ribosomal protein S18 acetylase RimI-like enzyme
MKNALDDANTILVAVLDGMFVGMVGCRHDVSPKLQHCGMVWGMYVAPQQRGRGVGRRLLAAVKEHGIGQAYTMLKLSVTNYSAAAQTLYSEEGFTVYGHEPALLCIDGITYDAYHMMYTYPRK